jgi:hypothetical protein
VRVCVHSLLSVPFVSPVSRASCPAVRTFYFWYHAACRRVRVRQDITHGPQGLPIADARSELEALAAAGVSLDPNEVEEPDAAPRGFSRVMGDGRTVYVVAETVEKGVAVVCLRPQGTFVSATHSVRLFRRSDTRNVATTVPDTNVLGGKLVIPGGEKCEGSLRVCWARLPLPLPPPHHPPPLRAAAVCAPRPRRSRKASKRLQPYRNGVAVPPVRTATASFTLEGWFKLVEAPPAQQGVIVCPDTASRTTRLQHSLALLDHPGLGLLVYASRTTLGVQASTGPATQIPLPAGVLGHWAHFAVVVDDATRSVCILVNGACVLSMTPASWLPMAMVTSSSMCLVSFPLHAVSTGLAKAEVRVGWGWRASVLPGAGCGVGVWSWPWGSQVGGRASAPLHAPTTPTPPSLCVCPLPFCAGLQVCELRLWSVARHPSDIITWMFRDVVLPCPDLLALWHFNDDTGVFAVDSTHNGHDAVLWTMAMVKAGDRPVEFGDVVAPLRLPTAALRKAVVFTNGETMAMYMPLSSTCTRHRHFLHCHNHCPPLQAVPCVGLLGGSRTDPSE